MRSIVEMGRAYEYFQPSALYPVPLVFIIQNINQGLH